MANIITGIRVLSSIALLFCPALSAAFYAFYLLAGLSDMLDGAVARKTNSVSEFGTRLDTAADILFAAVCLMKLLPVLSLPAWMYLWIAGITTIKLTSIIVGYARQKKLVAVHSVMNKLTGALCFALPLTLAFVDVRYSSLAVCTFATAASLYEGYLVLGSGNTVSEQVQ
ncbi:MAG: CDP-alcohol phosphatidyltransferase family protein [Treponema sp.]|nr:CDP-alcohol phosphatidyltransferase family protein [Treponema sp.]